MQAKLTQEWIGGSESRLWVEQHDGLLMHIMYAMPCTVIDIKCYGGLCSHPIMKSSLDSYRVFLKKYLMSLVHGRYTRRLCVEFNLHEEAHLFNLSKVSYEEQRFLTSDRGDFWA